MAIRDASDSWAFQFAAATGRPFAAGYYTAARRYPFTVFNGLEVSGSGRGCNALTGRFIVREIVFGSGGTVAAIRRRLRTALQRRRSRALRRDPVQLDDQRRRSVQRRVSVLWLSLTTPVHGRITGAGIDCGGAGDAMSGVAFVGGAD